MERVSAMSPLSLSRTPKPTLSPFHFFMLSFTMTLVSKISLNILLSKLLRILGLTNIMPFGETSGTSVGYALCGRNGTTHW